MADLSVTKANVDIEDAGTQLLSFVAGEILDAGETAYFKPSDSKVYLGDCDDSAETARVRGVVYQDAAADAIVLLIIRGKMNPGATVVKGHKYLQSDNPGKLYTDATAPSVGDRITTVYTAVATDKVIVGVEATEVQA